MLTVIHALIQHLLWLYYSNHGNVRHLVLAFYRWQQPGMPHDWYGRYGRFLIIHYPHAMRACITALRHHVAYAKLGQVCP